MRVQVYRNLNNGLISIQDLSTGLVLGHASAVDLQEATFIVREAGRQQVIREQRKNVHAFVRGKVIDVRNFKPFKGRGEAMPQTIEEWKHLVDLDEVAMRRMVKQIGDLKSRVASLSQKVASQQIKLDRGDA